MPHSVAVGYGGGGGVRRRLAGAPMRRVASYPRIWLEGPMSCRVHAAHVSAGPVWRAAGGDCAGGAPHATPPSPPIVPDYGEGRVARAPPAPASSDPISQEFLPARSAKISPSNTGCRAIKLTHHPPEQVCARRGRVSKSRGCTCRNESTCAVEARACGARARARARVDQTMGNL